ARGAAHRRAPRRGPVAPPAPVAPAAEERHGRRQQLEPPGAGLYSTVSLAIDPRIMSEHNPQIILIACVASNGVIGRSEADGSGAMPWHLPEDLRHFRELTNGHVVVMGRRTWESLPE